MKNKCLISLLMLILPMAVCAQSLNHAQLQSSIFSPSDAQLLVRNWDNQQVVAFHDAENGVYFSCTDYSAFFSSYPSMPSTAPAFFDNIFNDIWVYDMEIVDDIVFFCGYKSVTSVTPTVYHGVVGWFDLNLFVSGTFAPRIIDVPDAFELLKMVAYKVGSKYKVVAVGYNSNIPVFPYSLADNSTIVEIDDVTGAPTYYYSIIDRSTGLNEYIHDIVYTGQSVVLVGIVKQFTNPLYHIRIFDNPASLHTSILGDKVFYFTSGVSNEVQGRTYPTLMNDGTIAITYVHHEPSLGTYETWLRVVDTFIPTPSNINSQAFSIDYKYEPIDLAYSKKEETLVLMQHVKYYYNYNPQFVFLKPLYSSSYNANLSHFRTDFTPTSLDIYSKSSFVAVGERNQTYLQAIPTQINYCPELNDVKVAPIPNSSTVLSVNPLIWASPTLSVFGVSQPVVSGVWNTFCSQ